MLKQKMYSYEEYLNEFSKETLPDIDSEQSNSPEQQAVELADETIAILERALQE